MTAFLSGLWVLALWCGLAWAIWRGITKPPRARRGGVVRQLGGHWYLDDARTFYALHDPEER